MFQSLATPSPVRGLRSIVIPDLIGNPFYLILNSNNCTFNGHSPAIESKSGVFCTVC